MVKRNKKGELVFLDNPEFNSKSYTTKKYFN